MASKGSWELQEGDEVAPGRSVLKPLGGGNLYEVYLVWDDRLFAVMVAKLLRPDLVDDERARRGLERERRRLRGSPTPYSCAGSAHRSRAGTRTCSWSTWRAPRCAA